MLVGLKSKAPFRYFVSGCQSHYHNNSACRDKKHTTLTRRVDKHAKPYPEPQSLRLVDLKRTGDLLKHEATSIPAIEYDPFNLVDNPCITNYDSDQLQISLDLDSDTFWVKPAGFSERNDSSSVGTMSGRLRVVVKGSEPIALTNMQTRLSGYTCEYAFKPGKCKRSGHVEMVNSPKSGSSSGKTPFIQDVIYFNGRAELERNKPVLLRPGIYDYKFEFIIDSRLFPPSTATHLGSTTYRLESFVTVPKRSKVNDTVLLTSSLNLVRVLQQEARGGFLESGELHTSYRDGLLDCHVSLDSYVVEFDTPFLLSLQLVRQRECQIKFVQIGILQTISVPYMSNDNGPILNDDYQQRQTSLLHRVGGFDAAAMRYNLKIGNLTLPPSLKQGKYDNNFFPSYGDYNVRLSSTRSSRPRLKISHELNVLITLVQEDAKKACLSVKIPILVVDKDSGINSQLPRYEPSGLNLRQCSSDGSDTSGASVLSPPDYVVACSEGGEMILS
ncbi:LADA_0H04258g1_1 [Lachancea dasiensis]|uniref:LADA_0H04258g1_1 n=1 Tax=Lachancea dasiensis TaxID=1072105 RepID=A0A1G4K0M1_9SACH|nr:LADA_0H04258g1_1 [Lachancea dasiensis]